MSEYRLRTKLRGSVSQTRAPETACLRSALLALRFTRTIMHTVLNVGNSILQPTRAKGIDHAAVLFYNRPFICPEITRLDTSGETP
jgi:hypothetical protein